MKNRGSSSSGMFLIELLLAILIFAIASAICLQVFVTAHQTAEGSSRLNRAVVAAQGGAECFKAAGGDMAETSKLLGQSAVTGGDSGDTLVQYFDSSWKPVKPVSQDDFSYILMIRQLSKQDGLTEGAVTVDDAAGNLIFSIPVSAAGNSPANTEASL